MKTLYIDCGMGAAGDMLVAALSELLPDKRVFTDKMNVLGIPGIHMELVTDYKCGICGTHAVVSYHGMEETPDHHHSHDHAHGVGANIAEIVDTLHGLSPKVRQDIKNIYALLLEAESHVHGKPMEHVHFHELGTMDALADIAGVCVLMDLLSPDRVVASPVCTGSGHVKCAHGILPVPAPAAAYLLKGSPIYAGEIKTELCTPTGAALLKYFVTSFEKMPEMSITAIGYGLGTKDFGVANCLRVLMGTVKEKAADLVTEICCNLDDMLPEDLGFVQELLFQNGALDVYTIPIYMKKNRPGVMLCCLCRPHREEALSQLILKHTTSWGVRKRSYERTVLPRMERTAVTPYGEVRIKSAKIDGITKEKPEYDDLERIAKKEGLSIREVRKML